jgi:hypothetical protein
LKKTAFILTLLLALLFSAKTGKVLAQTYQVGVSEGDIFSYEVGVSGYIPDFPYQGIDKIGTMSVKVTSVSGPSINFTVDMDYRNGTRTSQETLINVQTGGPINIPVPRFFFSANSGIGNSAIPYRSGPRINDTIVTLYSSGGQEKQTTSV